MKKNKVIITGPTGAVGSALINELLSNDYEVFAVVRRNSKRISNLKCNQNLHIIECNLNEYKTQLKNLINTNVDYFYHLAWDGTYGEKRNNYQLQLKNIEYSMDAVDVAFLLNCKCFIGVGSQSEYGNYDEIKKPNGFCNPNNFYGSCKLSASYNTRILCNKYNIRHCWCRIFSLYGLHDNENTLIMSTIHKMLNNQECNFTKGDQIWDYIYSKDAALAFRLIAERGKNNAIYLIASGDKRQLKDYIISIRDIVNPSVKINFGTIPYFENQVMNLTADISDLKNDLNFKCKYSFEEGIKDLLIELKK